jgi:putative glutamine amidotransferase
VREATPSPAPRPPRIGINCDRFADPQTALDGVRAPYWRAVAAAGGLPMLIPFLDSAAAAASILDVLDGFVLIGGDDLRAERLGQPNPPGVNPVCPERDRSDFLLIDALLGRALPTLAICLGFQELNVALGGTIMQALEAEPAGRYLPHRGPAGSPFLRHPVRLEPNGPLARWWARDGAEVNSAHHQALDRLAPGLKPLAWAPDGLVEAVAVADHPFFVGVQWHPERMAEADPLQHRIFVELAVAAQKS